MYRKQDILDVMRLVVSGVSFPTPPNKKPANWGG